VTWRTLAHTLATRHSGHMRCYCYPTPRILLSKSSLTHCGWRSWSGCKQKELNICSHFFQLLIPANRLRNSGRTQLHGGWHGNHQAGITNVLFFHRLSICLQRFNAFNGTLPDYPSLNYSHQLDIIRFLSRYSSLSRVIRLFHLTLTGHLHVLFKKNCFCLYRRFPSHIFTFERTKKKVNREMLIRE